MSDNPVDQYPGPVSFDIRVTCLAEEMPKVVKTIERLAHEFEWGLDYLPGERLPYQHVPDSPAELIEHDHDDPDWQGDPEYYKRMD